MDRGSFAKSRHRINLLWVNPGICGVEHFPAGRGEDKNPPGGVGRDDGENLRGGAKKRENLLIQKLDKTA